MESLPIDAEQTHPLRVSVLRPGRPAHEIVFPGDDAPSTRHLGTYNEGGELIAIASLYHERRALSDPGDAAPGSDHDSGTAWRIRGMATAPTARRTGAGAAALVACEQHARVHGATLMWCNARTGAIAFYEAAGWNVIGPQFDIATVGPHVVMEKHLA